MKLNKPQAVIVFSSFVFTLVFLYFFRFFSLDDAAIYQRMIANTLNFGRYTYNLDRPINAGTSMLYPFLVMPFALVFKSFSLHGVSVALDSILLFFAAFFLGSYVLRSTKSLSLAVLSSSLALILPVGDLLGMETALLLFFFGSYLNFFNDSRVRYLLTALFPLVRPECAVFWGVEGLIRLHEQKFRPRAWIPATISCLPLLVPVLLALTFNYLSFGAPLPQSVTNKMEQGAGGFDLYFSHLKNIFSAIPQSASQQIVFVFVVLGIIPIFMNRLLSLQAFFVGIFVWQTTIILLQVPNYSWYAVPLFYFWGLCFIFGLSFVFQIIAKSLDKKYSLLVNVALCLAVFLFSWENFFPRKVRLPESRQFVQNETGKFIISQNDQHPVEVAALEVGHLGSSLPGDLYSIYDLCGLTSKNNGFFHANFRTELFCERRPEYLTLNYYSRLDQSGVMSLQTKGENYNLERSPVSNNFHRVWPYLQGLAMDPLLMKNYQFLTYIEGAGYPGGIAVFKQIENSSCSQSQGIAVKKVSASAEESSSQALTDSNLSTIWNAKNFAPQTTTFAFSSDQRLGKIELYANTDKPSNTSLQVRFIDESGVDVKRISVPLEFNDGDVLSLTFDETTARSVELLFEGGQSWVAWREISFFSTDRE